MRPARTEEEVEQGEQDEQDEQVSGMECSGPSVCCLRIGRREKDGG